MFRKFSNDILNMKLMYTSRLSCFAVFREAGVVRGDRARRDGAPGAGRPHPPQHQHCQQPELGRELRLARRGRGRQRHQRHRDHQGGGAEPLVHRTPLTSGQHRRAHAQKVRNHGNHTSTGM